MTHPCGICGEPVNNENFRCKQCRIKRNKLIFIKYLYSSNIGKIGLYKCSCGKETKVAISMVNNGYILSCGCIKNENKRHLLSPEEIPDEFKHLIKLNTSCQKIGKTHHRQWGSIVKCLLCGKNKWLRNDRVRINIKRKGFPYNCKSCGVSKDG